jgi:hypothetical protein
MAVSRVRTLLTLVLGCAAAACAQPRADVAEAQTSTCTLQVIVALDTAPDAALLADLSRVSGAHLELIRTMTSNLHLLALQAQGGDSAKRRWNVCAATRGFARWMSTRAARFSSRNGSTANGDRTCARAP